MNNFEEYTTKFVQEVGNKEGAVSPVVTSSASFAYGTPETAEGIFDGSIKNRYILAWGILLRQSWNLY